MMRRGRKEAKARLLLLLLLRSRIVAASRTDWFVPQSVRERVSEWTEREQDKALDQGGRV